MAPLARRVREYRLMVARAFRGPIRVILHSGLGNQMFQYAAAKALAVERGCDLLIDTVTGFKDDP